MLLHVAAASLFCTTDIGCAEITISAMSDDATAQVRSARRLKYSAARTGEDHQDTSAIIRRDEECPFVIRPLQSNRFDTPDTPCNVKRLTLCYPASHSSLPIPSTLEIAEGYGRPAWLKRVGRSGTGPGREPGTARLDSFHHHSQISVRAKTKAANRNHENITTQERTSCINRSLSKSRPSGTPSSTTEAIHPTRKRHVRQLCKPLAASP